MIQPLPVYTDSPESGMEPRLGAIGLSPFGGASCQIHRRKYNNNKDNKRLWRPNEIKDIGTFNSHFVDNRFLKKQIVKEQGIVTGVRHQIM